MQGSDVSSVPTTEVGSQINIRRVFMSKNIGVVGEADAHEPTHNTNNGVKVIIVKKVNSIPCKCLGVVGEANAQVTMRNTNNGVKNQQR